MRSRFPTSLSASVALHGLAAGVVLAAAPFALRSDGEPEAAARTFRVAALEAVEVVATATPEPDEPVEAAERDPAPAPPEAPPGPREPFPEAAPPPEPRALLDREGPVRAVPRRAFDRPAERPVVAETVTREPPVEPAVEPAVEPVREAAPPAAEVEAEVVPPSPIPGLCPPPRVPVHVARRGLSGTATLLVTVAADGTVRAVEVESSSGWSVLDELAADAVRAWRFEPARRGETAVEQVVRQPVEFR